MQGRTVEEHLNEITDDFFEESIMSNASSDLNSNEFHSGGICAEDDFVLVDNKIIYYNKIPNGSKYTTNINGQLCTIIVSGNGNKTIKYNGMFVME